MAHRPWDHPCLGSTAPFVSPVRELGGRGCFVGTAGKEDDVLLVRALGVQNQGFGAKMLSQVCALALLPMIWANLLPSLGLSFLVC